MTLLTQVVILRWEEGGEQEELKLRDIQPGGSGRLQWAAVKETFNADLVKIVREGSPALIEEGEWKGFTIDTFQPGSTILVTVSRKAQGEDRATGQTVTNVPCSCQTHRDCRSRWHLEGSSRSGLNMHWAAFLEQIEGKMYADGPGCALIITWYCAVSELVSTYN